LLVLRAGLATRGLSFSNSRTVCERSPAINGSSGLRWLASG
jgi:hypothetical protein